MHDYSTHELTIADQDGTNVTRHDSADKAYKYAYKYALANWNTDDWGEPSSDERAVIASYFDKVAPNGHWFSITEPMQLEPGTAVSAFDRLPSGMVRWNGGHDGYRALTDEEAAARSAQIRTEQNAKMIAAAIEKQRGKYPTRWPSKLRHVLDVVRDAIEENPDWIWTWYRDAGAKGGIPKGAFVVTNTRHGNEEMYASIEAFAEECAIPMPKEVAAALMAAFGIGKAVRKTTPRQTPVPVAAPAVASAELTKMTARLAAAEARAAALEEFVTRAMRFILNGDLNNEATALLQAA